MTPQAERQPASARSAPRLALRATGWVLVSLTIGYALICALMFLDQRRLQYVPDARAVEPAASARNGVRSLSLGTADGERISAWWAPPRDDQAPVVLYLHGNGANLAAREARFAWIAARGAGLLALSWRGYGGSTGTPTEHGLMEDARAGWRALVEGGSTVLAPDSAGPRTPIPPSRVVIFGESLGTQVAVMLAADVQPGGVVLDSGFASALEVAQHRYPWLPVAWLMLDPFRADLAAPRVRSPVLQIHCADDPVTPRDSAERLHALLPRALPLLTVPDRCHAPSLVHFETALATFLDQPEAP